MVDKTGEWASSEGDTVLYGRGKEKFMSGNAPWPAADRSMSSLALVRLITEAHTSGERLTVAHVSEFLPRITWLHGLWTGEAGHPIREDVETQGCLPQSRQKRDQRLLHW